MTSRIVESQPPDAAWSEAEAELLAAARADRMPVELEARLREALDFPAVASADAALRPTLNDSATPTPLFASKLPLWGMLGIVAIGAVSYYTLSSSRPQPSAASPSAAALVQQPPAHDLPNDQSATNQPAPEAQPVAAQEPPARQLSDARDPTSPQRSAAAQGASARGGSEELEAASARGLAAQGASVRGGGAQPANLQRSAAAQGASVRGWSEELEAASARGSAARRERGELALRRGAPRVSSEVAPPSAAEREAAERVVAVSAPAAENGKVASPDQLRIEAELLEHARSALGQGALSDARRWLARYRAQFAHGALRPESQVLGIELATRAGESATAKTQADDFLAHYPNHPLRDRVRQLTAQGVGAR
jgi:hypothetical protein